MNKPGFPALQIIGRIVSALLCMSVLLSACSGAQPTGTTTSPTSLPPTSNAMPPTEAATATAAPTSAKVVPPTGLEPTRQSTDCPATPAETRVAQPLTMGPINGVDASNAPGERLVITGTVYDRDCSPVQGLALNFWQTDPAGVYGPGHGTNNMLCCYYGGEAVTDEQGRYTLLTVMPGVYQGETSPPPAHIHVEGMHPSGTRLESEVVFQDDPHLSGIYTNPPPILLEEASDDLGRYLMGVADFKLSQEVETPVAPTSSSPSTVQTFRILNGESSASYQIREKFADIAEIVSPVGVTTGVEGEIQLNMASPPTLKAMTVTVDLRGLRTDDPNRDEKLADRWLVTNVFPYATFTAREVKDGPVEYQDGQEVSFTLTGDLTIRDITRPVDFDVTASVSGDTLTGSAEAKFLMSDFGVDPPNLLGFVKVEDEVTVRVMIRAVLS